MPMVLPADAVVTRHTPTTQRYPMVPLFRSSHTPWVQRRIRKSELIFFFTKSVYCTQVLQDDLLRRGCPRPAGGVHSRQGEPARHNAHRGGAPARQGGVAPVAGLIYSSASNSFIVSFIFQSFRQLTCGRSVCRQNTRTGHGVRVWPCGHPAEPPRSAARGRFPYLALLPNRFAFHTARCARFLAGMQHC